LPSYRLWITFVTTPQIYASLSSLITIGSKESFSGFNKIFFPFLTYLLTVSSPSTTAMTTFPFSAFKLLSTTSMSFGKIPA
jgi:hypothetical protein